MGFQNRGLRVPEDISVVGMDDLLTSAFIAPGITSIRPPLREMAKIMVSRIVRRLADPAAETEEQIFSPQLTERGSVANLLGGTPVKAPGRKGADEISALR